MIKRVRLDESGRLTEIDWKAAKRLASEIMTYIKNAPLEECNKFNYKNLMVPILNNIIDGSLKIPFLINDRPYNIRYQIEGLEPELNKEFSILYSSLMGLISASTGVISLSIHNTGDFIIDADKVFDPDGTEYELCWFED